MDVDKRASKDVGRNFGASGFLFLSPNKLMHFAMGLIHF